MSAWPRWGFDRRLDNPPEAPVTVQQLTPQHVEVLIEIDSPWALVAFPAGDDETYEKLARALRSVTEPQLAEFAFIVTHQPDESRAILARGRVAFATAAMAFVVNKISRESLPGFVATNGPDLVKAYLQQNGFGEVKVR